MRMATNIVRTIPQVQAEAHAHVDIAISYLQQMRAFIDGVTIEAPGRAHQAVKAGCIAEAAAAQARDNAAELTTLIRSAEMSPTAEGSPGTEGGPARSA